MGIEEILQAAAREQDKMQREKSDKERNPLLVQKAGNPDTELMNSLLKRVGMLERQLEDKKKELMEKTIVINDLQKKVLLLEGCADQKEVKLSEQLQVQLSETSVKTKP